MRKVSFNVGKLKTHVVSGMKHTQAFFSRHKKIQYGTAATLAVFAAPFAAHAMNGGLSQEPAPQGNSASQKESVQKQTAGDGATQGAFSDTSKTEVQVDSSRQYSDSGGSDVDVHVNGQKVPVPKNGQVHKRISDNGNETVVDVQVENGGSNHSTKSSTNISVEQHSYSSGDVTKEGGSNNRHSRRR